MRKLIATMVVLVAFLLPAMAQRTVMSDATGRLVVPTNLFIPGGLSVTGASTFVGPSTFIGPIIVAGLTNINTIAFGTNHPNGVVISMPPLAPNSSNGNYTITRETTKFAPTFPNDETLTIGMNQAAGGVKANTNTAAMWLQWENGYTQAGTTNTWSEFHLDFLDATNHSLRPFSITMDWRNLSNIVELESVSTQTKANPVNGSNYFQLSPYQMNWMSSVLNYTNGFTISADSGSVNLTPYVGTDKIFGLSTWSAVYLPGASAAATGWDLSASMAMISSKQFRFYSTAGGAGGIDLRGDQGVSLATNSFLTWSAAMSSDTPVVGLWGSTNLLRITTGRDTNTFGSLDASNVTARGSSYISNNLAVTAQSMFMGGVNLSNNSILSFSTNNTNPDTFLQRGFTAGTVEQRNGTNPQTNALYNTFTDSGNREWAENAWDANVLSIGRVKKSGSGSSRNAIVGGGNGMGDLYFDVGSGGQKLFRRGITIDWYFNASGNLIAGTDNTPDIGASGATRPRNIYVGTAVYTPLGILTKTANYTVSASEPGTFFNNSGTAGVTTNTLPASVAGLQYNFAIVTAKTNSIVANGTDTIRNAATVSAAGGMIFSSTIGSTVHLFCPVTGQWFVDSINGTWVVQ